jgi:hypothetical protein
MRPSRWLALAAGLSLLPALAACASDDGGRTAGVIHRLLLAAATEGSGTLESFAGRLPDDLPVEPPRYPGADLIMSSRQPAPFTDTEVGPEQTVPQPTLYFIVFDTADEREDVFAFYEEALDKDPWQLESAFSTGELDTLEFSKVDDADIAGAVSIARGGEDGRTSILISLQDAGAFREEAPPFELGASLPVPKELPEDVPLYPGATITSTAFFREPGNESFLVIFLTTDSQDEIVQFYRDQFHERDWSVLEGAPLGLEERIDFRDEGGDIQGSLLADRFPRDRSYTEVRLQVRVNPSREPASGETPQPTQGSEDGSNGQP